MPKGPPPIIGIDGEGYTDAKGRHLYTYMAACSADGLISELVCPKGADFEAVADWLLSLPKHALLAGFSLGYDRAKWLQSLPDEVIYAIEHPELRQTAHGSARVEHGDYLVSLLATRFSVAEKLGGSLSKGNRNGHQRRTPKCKTRVVWDFFRFYQSSFVKALTRWNVGTPEECDRIARMKEKRGSFSGISESEKAYCLLECRLFAEMARATLDAFASEGIEFKSPYGPGSAANVVLARMGAGKQRAKMPREMLQAAECAYFGGRFEMSHVGPVRGKLYGYDIASAYPYAMTLLPCMAHGEFMHVTDRKSLSRAIHGEGVACLSYRLDAPPPSALANAWGPLPFRLPDGNIVFPIECGGGWAWNVELRAALRLHPGIRVTEGWVWQRLCDCPPPFKAEIERLYARRLELGKGARGLVLKLVLNSLYGKSAQRVGGGGKFRCLVRAGLITATTRAMLLGAIVEASDPWNILELATDSVLSRERLSLPLGTTLGAWEEKSWPKGAFLIRPGMRFSLLHLHGKDAAHTAARGLGVKVLHKNRERILRAWEREPMGPLKVQQPAMFHGARSSVWRVESGDFDPDEVLFEYRRSADYGQWTDPTPRLLSYAPGPKRSGIIASPVVARGIAMVPWRLPMALRSAPYRAMPADEWTDLRAREAEQPEGGMLEVV
jgi:DNA polymerase type B, organellar and viral